MNRIDHRPVVSVLNGADGAQLQRRMLQELERQWLDSWGTASAAQSEAPAAAAAQETKTARFQTLAENGSQGSVRSVAGRGLQSVVDKAAGSSSQAQMRADTNGRRVAPPEPSVGPAEAGNDSANAAEAPPQTATGAQQPALHSSSPIAPTGAMTSSSTESVSASAGLLALSGMTRAAPPGLAIAVRALPFQNGTEPDAASTPLARANPKPQAQDGDLGSHKLTLRELAPDLVQATLRDTQLDLPASQLAAQGLARALMEAGYAQVRVVVNGQHSRSGAVDPDDTTASSVPSDAFTASLPKTAAKDRSHGN
jgi:hypothetical protein